MTTSGIEPAAFCLVAQWIVTCCPLIFPLYTCCSLSYHYLHNMAQVVI